MGKSNNSSVVTAHSATSPTSNRMGTTVEVPLPDTIPIIFVPGIMGSNIKHQKLGKVWDMPNSTVGGLKTANKRSQLKPEELQRQLDPQQTSVDDSGTIQVDQRLRLNEATLRKRYWGTVHWDSYGNILTYLQLALNNVSLQDRPLYGGGVGGGYAVMVQMKQQEAIYEWQSLLSSNETSKWEFEEPFQAASTAEIDHLKKFNFPVYAMGYNWLQSNEDSAQIIVKKLEKIKAEYGSKFHKFIIVTHSMGGLVTRRLAQLCGDDIAGVVHGVMPADGAAAAYRRIVSGSYEGGGVKPWVTSFVLGKDTEHVTAVLANSPGGLELLPNAEYNNRQPWLTLQGKNEHNQLMQVKLPTKNVRGEVDPYEQIYKADKVWWEMVREELVDPAKMVKGDNPDNNPKEVYKLKIDKVKKFHASIAKQYHACTYVNYGHDKKFMSFGTLTWSLDRQLRGLSPRQLQTLPRATAQQIGIYRQKTVQEQIEKIKEGKGSDVNNRDLALENNGIRYILLSSGKLGSFAISTQDAPGDGTVPYQSGCAPLKQKGVKQVFKMTGFDHQGSYNNAHVKRSVLYSIVKIIKENNIQPKFR
ncbi:lysophospholipase [Acinetobacter colistiniresistens]|uniref:esterase/lipase family protein n=1 Tax=Acinetobacter colistiniresistens TaxID=280145 RepID=UPI00211D07B6|nr:lysophospholipase [Acinetobacter colistiniresistens]UUM26616.1 lysophospholipase [Acinetobacter colistiniresistens]